MSLREELDLELSDKTKMSTPALIDFIWKNIPAVFDVANEVLEAIDELRYRHVVKPNLQRGDDEQPRD